MIGKPGGGTGRAELEPLIGFFVNTLAMRLNGRGEPTVAELLARTKSAGAGGAGAQDLPFEQVVEVVQPARSLAHAPIFQVMFAWQNTPQGQSQLPGLQASTSRARTDTAQFDLTLDLQETEDGSVVRLSYATALFDRSTVERYVACCAGLLEGMVGGRCADRVALAAGLTRAERRRCSSNGTRPARSYPRDRCFHELFEAQVERAPEAVAVVFGEDELTYGELNARANRLAHYLRRLGVGPDARVAICVERSLRDGRGVAGDVEGGRRVRAAGSGVSGGAPGVHAGGQRAGGRATWSARVAWPWPG